MSALLKFEVEAVWLECSQCHVAFAITTSHQARLRSDRTTFHCPNGHNQWYPGETEAQKVRKEMQAKVDEANRLTEWHRAQASKDAKAAKKARAELKRTTTRIHAGVCTCCNRTFQNLARHMKTKHSNDSLTQGGNK